MISVTNLKVDYSKTDMKLKNAILHFNKIWTHKYWVAKYCFKCGLYWQGLVHDLSKLSPIEFSESVKFFQGDSSPIPVAKREQGYSLAWQHHKGRSPHHYEYWTDNYDMGTTCIPMPYKYAVELICDWLGAARAYLGSEFSYKKEWEWWCQKRDSRPKIHQQTMNFVDLVFYLLMLRETQWKCAEPERILERNLPYIFELSKKYNSSQWDEFWKEMVINCKVHF